MEASAIWPYRRESRRERDLLPIPPPAREGDARSLRLNQSVATGYLTRWVTQDQDAAQGLLNIVLREKPYASSLNWAGVPISKALLPVPTRGGKAP
jgi:hypothetical protein